MDHWMEMRTALMVARLGTVKAAAAELGVHRATVNRHVETLEAAFGAPLFQRHARGYTLTETGQDMLDVANRADEMFTDLTGRSRGRAGKLSGALVITALPGVAPLIMPAIKEFHRAHPEIALEVVASLELARLEHGEAHVAFRAGPKPDTPDYVVTLFREIRFGLYASRSYVDHAGLPHIDRLETHKFVGTIGGPAPFPFLEWMEANVPPAALVLRSIDPQVTRSAVLEGIGLGFLPEYDAKNRTDLIEIIPPRDEWTSSLWTVTHVDLHRTEKVQEFLKQIRALQT